MLAQKIIKYKRITSYKNDTNLVYKSDDPWDINEPDNLKEMFAYLRKDKLIKLLHLEDIILGEEPTFKQTKGRYLRNKQAFKPNMTINNPELINKIYEELFIDRIIYKKVDYLLIIDVILANGLLSFNNFKVLSKLNVDYWWGSKRIYNNVLSELTKAGYFNHYRGYSSKIKDKEWGFTAKHAPTNKFKIFECPLYEVRKTHLISITKKDPKTLKKVRINPPKNKFYKKIEKEITIIHYGDVNKIKIIKSKLENKKHHLFKIIDGDDYFYNNEYMIEIDKEYLFLNRGFCRGNYESGGRFYTQIFQNIPSKIRKGMQIDGEETVELDFASLHINLLYHQIGKKPPELCYMFRKNDKKNDDLRCIYKLMILIMINAKDFNSGMKALTLDIREKLKTGELDSRFIKYKWDYLKYLFKEFEEYHNPIKEFFCSDVGVKLQRKDSDIMNDILLELNSLGIVGLPIHDSVIVQKKHRDVLKKVMQEKYFLHTGYEIEVS